LAAPAAHKSFRSAKLPEQMDQLAVTSCQQSTFLAKIDAFVKLRKKLKAESKN
jgi:hypothetical protein